MARGSVVARTRWLMVAVAGLSVAVVFLVFYLAWTSFTIGLRTDELSRQAQVIASGIEAADPSGSGVAEREPLRRFFTVEAGLIGASLVITDADGNVEFSTDEVQTGGSLPLDRLGEAGDDGVRSVVADLDQAGRVLMVAVPLGDEGRVLAALQPLREVNRTQGWVALLLALSAAVAVVVAWFAGGWSAGRLAGPILRLERASEEMGEGAFGRQVPVEGDDEVARLAVAFNQMSTRVEAAYRAQKDFVGNVSHEMRTPVTTIAGFSGALVDGTVSDPEARDRYLRVIHDEAGRLGDLASVLLELADLDAGVSEPALEDIDLAGLGRGLLDRHGPAAGDAEVSLDIALEGTIEADERLLAQALSTLVENAIRYAPAGSVIVVAARIGARGVRLTVDDAGPGVPVDMRERVFERFVRLEASRSKGGGGTGLGLAICRRMVEVMGGTVLVEDSDLGGARFVIELAGDAADST